MANELVALGMKEGSGNQHEGQGTSNRRFHFDNCTLEFLWVYDVDEAINGPGSGMRLVERIHERPLSNSYASPFGIIVNRKDSANLGTPFNGWAYHPGYFKHLSLAWYFHIGANSNCLLEPLCVYMPFVEPDIHIHEELTKEKGKRFIFVTQVRISVPVESLSRVLTAVAKADRLHVEPGGTHLMEVTFDEQCCGQSRDFRPKVPLIING